MITGEGARPDFLGTGVPRFSHDDFFADGEGWDFLILQDHAASIKDWVASEEDSTRLIESLDALDVFASWVQIAATKMRRKPSVILFHRMLWGYKDLVTVSNCSAMCAKGAEGMELYRRRLQTRLGPHVPVRTMPACQAFCLAHKEGQDVFKQLYAGDGEHPSRMGSYLSSLLLFRLVTGLNVLSAPDIRPVDDGSRLHADMWLTHDQWLSSDDFQRQSWPEMPLPNLNDELVQRLRLWAHTASMSGMEGSYTPSQCAFPPKGLLSGYHLTYTSKQGTAYVALQASLSGPVLSHEMAPLSNRTRVPSKIPPSTTHVHQQPNLDDQAVCRRSSGRFPQQVLVATIGASHGIVNCAQHLEFKRRAATW
jgi:hypothetical protein